MASNRGRFPMAASKVAQQLSFQSWTHAVGELSIQGRLESRFNASGKLLFVLAYVPKHDFVEKYGSNAISSIVHRGRVLVLENRNRKIFFSDKFNHHSIEVEFSTDKYGFSCLKLKNKKNTICQKSIGFDNEQSFRFDLKTIRWIADRFIDLVQVGAGLSAHSHEKRTTLHIVPEEDEFSSDEIEFSRSQVLFH
jgi:hypothetical protein